MWFLLRGLVVLGTVSGVAAAQTTMYTSANLPLYTAARGAQVGTVMLATPVKVLKTDGPYSQVVIRGWGTQKAPHNIFIGMGQRNKLVGLSTGAQVPRSVLKTATDDYMTVWEAVDITGWLESSKLVKDQKMAFGPASKLFAANCAKCHPAPASTVHTTNEWIGVINAMAPRTGLPREQLDLILKYLQFNAKK